MRAIYGPATAACALIVAIAGSPAADARDVVTQGLLIDHVAVVDVHDGRIAVAREIVIAGGRIQRIVPAHSVQATGSARLVEGHGAFVVPGYNDMHAHNLNTASPQTSLPMMLANGVTGFRQMAGSPELLAARAAGQRILPLESPALLAMPGTILAGPAFATPEAVKAEVDRQKTEGADFIKIIDVPPAAYLAAIDEAKAQGLPIGGHLTPQVDPREAISHGMDSIEHLGPTIALLLACSTNETPIRAMLRAMPPSAGNIDFNEEPAKLERRLANPVLLLPPQGFLLMRRILASYDEGKCLALAQTLAASQTWVVPTLTRLEAMNLGNEPALRHNPDLEYVPAVSRDMWLDVGTGFDSKLTADQHQVLADLFARQLQMARMFDRAGVKMLSGTDFGGQWIVPGRSLHREFDLLASAGIAPLHILQMTTLDPARYLHREAAMGSVEAGKQADLVLLSANPVLSAANLHGITGVVRDGRYLSRADLDAIERRVVTALK